MSENCRDDLQVISVVSELCGFTHNHIVRRDGT